MAEFVGGPKDGEESKGSHLALYLRFPVAPPLPDLFAGSIPDRTEPRTVHLYMLEPPGRYYRYLGLRDE